MTTLVLLKRSLDGQWTVKTVDPSDAAVSVATTHAQTARVCPFCRSAEQEVVKEDSSYYVFCTACGAMGPESSSLLTAIQLWNGTAEGEKK